ncbi:MAG: hypothetical protein V1837_07495 [Candidatus Woesearchaeota archaeon]
MKTLSGTIVIVGLVALVVYMGGFGFPAAIEYLSSSIGLSKLVQGLVLAFSLVTILIIALTFLGLPTRKVIASDVKLKADNRDVPYDNVARINFDRTNLLDQLLGTGRVVFELTGFDRQKIEVGFVDNPKDLTIKIQQLLNIFKMRKFAQFADQQRIERIVQDF